MKTVFNKTKNEFLRCKEGYEIMAVFKYIKYGRWNILDNIIIW